MMFRFQNPLHGKFLAPQNPFDHTLQSQIFVAAHAQHELVGTLLKRLTRILRNLSEFAEMSRLKDEKHDFGQLINKIPANTQDDVT